MKPLAAFALLLAGCPAPACPSLATQCAGDVVEICDSAGQWRLVADCAEVARTSGGEWSCQTTREGGEEINACLPTHGTEPSVSVGAP